MPEISSLGKYEVRREIGRGAMGVVYEGYDPLIKRLVALKTIRADQLTGDEAGNVIARFRREAQAAGRLSHPNIVSIYDFGEDNGVWFIAMEFIKGRELKEFFDGNERFSIADIVRIMSQMLNALDYSHRQGVIHRDIKPANIFVMPDGSVKVADFGIAHIESSNLTQVGTVLGTPSYMSPEQIMGLPIDGRSDLFSAGVILYQFLTGERPFAGSATTTMQKVLKEDPLPPSSLNVQAPPAMDGVVRKALAKRPEERFQTAHEFAAAVRAAAEGMGAAVLPLQANPPGSTDATQINPAAEATLINTSPPAAASAAVATAIPPPSPQSAQKSQIAGVMVLVAVLVLAVGVGGWWYYRHQADTASAGLKGGEPSVAAKLPRTAPAASVNNGVAPPAIATGVAASTPVASKGDAGSLMISAVGIVDPSDPRYQSDKSLMQTDLRADSKGQLVEKALGLLLDKNSLAKNYDLLKDKLLSNSGNFVTTVVRESEPREGKDGLVSITTQGMVNVRAVQKSLNEMSRDERIDFIRASGDPKVSVRISVRDAGQADAPPQPSQVAENLLKERIKSFGFRTWAGGAADGKQAADFDVVGEAKIKKLSMRLEASGLTVTKYALTSWTVKCLDRETGEEIYYNTTLPKGAGSWASEEEALKAIGSRVGDEFSRNFFLQHVSVSGQPVTLSVSGLPDVASEELLARELIGLPGVITAVPRVQSSPRMYDIQLAGGGPAGDTVADSVLKPLNAKLGQACFALGSIDGNQVAVNFDKRCADASILSRLETNPPAGLYGAPAGRQKTVVKNPETLHKLLI
jgi:eukaryotic-like serine/threonine-protein kinase